MKKIFFSFLAIVALASCAKTEVAYTEADSEIKIAPVTSLATKAEVNKAIDGTTYPAAEHFTVIGYWNEAGAGSTFTDGTTYLAAVDFAKTKKGEYWAGSTESYYWPKNGSLRFACYSPSTIDGGTLTHELKTDTWTATGYVQSNDTEETIDFMVAQTPPSYTAQTAAENVSVVFEHALSWISFKVKAQDEAAADAFVVKSITVNDVFTQGDMVAKYPAKDWTVKEDTEKDYAVLTNGTTVPTVEAVEIVNTGVLVIPQETTTVTVTFTQNTLKDKNGALIEQALEIPLVLDVEHTPWEAGKHYIYTLIFGLDEILINPSVADWEDVLVNDVPATEEVATTAVELAAAINNGGQVRLGADITLNEVFQVNESINIDLNGYTLTANAADILFRVNDGATLTIGRGDVVAAAYIVSVNKGGVAVLNAGNYKAVTTAVQANGGKAYITGGTFEVGGDYGTTYLLNHIDGVKNDGLIEVTGGTFVGYNPAASSSENPAMNFVKAGYNVTAVNGNYIVTAADQNVTLADATVIYGTLSIKNSVLDGAGKTISAAAVPTNNGLIRPEGEVTVKNVTVDGNDAYVGESNLRGFYITKDGNYTIENVSVVDCGYAINVQATATLNVVNSTLEGWTSYGSRTTATFDNVKFTCGDYRLLPVEDNYPCGHFRPYGPTVLTNCTFEDGFTIDLGSVDPGATVKFDKCKIGTTEITAENIASLVNNYNANVVVF